MQFLSLNRLYVLEERPSFRLVKSPNHDLPHAVSSNQLFSTLSQFLFSSKAPPYYHTYYYVLSIGCRPESHLFIAIYEKSDGNISANEYYSEVFYVVLSSWTRTRRTFCSRGRFAPYPWSGNCRSHRGSFRPPWSCRHRLPGQSMSQEQVCHSQAPCEEHPD